MLAQVDDIVSDGYNRKKLAQVLEIVDLSNGTYLFCRVVSGFQGMTYQSVSRNYNIKSCADNGDTYTIWDISERVVSRRIANTKTARKLYPKAEIISKDELRINYETE